jgi:hypothetical protein
MIEEGPMRFVKCPRSEVMADCHKPRAAAQEPPRNVPFLASLRMAVGDMTVQKPHRRIAAMGARS